MLVLVLLDVLYVFSGPKPNFDATKRLDWGRFYFPLYDPAIKSTPADTKHLRHFDRRVRLHL